ncbi:NADH-quinone oxidoreductase subunit J [Jongsikchunia kroppenstedtii]|uniref:NADH-quinone oxidoreductase subunit J n=1 Tax=Jongsikchunia kroppenstedtii TaxID=1121721 RepID=UPI00037AD976|nr:NADH-quinone oxidoreductase subunit J [Jongsikchunia kroppenstedtii]
MIAAAIADPAVLAAVERTSTGEAVQFWVLAVIAVAGALGVVLSPKAVYSAVFLALTMIVIAICYVAQGAMFLGVAQVVVYTGAVMMLFLFVLMFIGVDSADAITENIRGQRVWITIAGVGFGVLLISAIGNAATTAIAGPRQVYPARPGADPSGNVEGLAERIFVSYLWAFELTGALLITATLGALILAHRERVEAPAGQRELSVRRLLPGGRMTPLPNPGVYARHNAVDMPARLPDGSMSDLSVNAGLTARELREKQDRERADRR